MNKIANRQVICETLMEQVKEDKSIVALCIRQMLQRRMKVR